MSRSKKRCKRLVATSSARRGYAFEYQRPVSKNDLKRDGKTLLICRGESATVLDGYGIRMLAKMLRDVGEVGRNVNKRRTRVLSTSLFAITGGAGK